MSPSAEPDHGRVATAAGVGGRIVVADDDPVIRTMVSIQLSRGGFTVIEAADGDEALEVCRSEQPELVLLDIEMPRRDGFEVLRELRSDSATAGLPVLLLTAHSSHNGAVKGLGLGAHDYIRKPFDLEELQARVEVSVLLGRRTRDLAASERRYRQVVDLAAEGIWILDHNWVVRFANSAIATMLGLSVPDLIGRPLTDFLDPDARVRAEEHRRRRAAGITETVENSLKHADGHLVWVRISASPLVDEDGERGSLAMLSDISGERVLERELAVREHRYATLVEHLPGSAVLVLDRDLRVVTAGGAALREAGHEPGALVGRLLEDVVPAEDFAAFRPKLIDALSGLRSGTLEFTDRSGIVALLDAVPLLSDRLGVDQILVAIRDVTALKKAEEALRSAEARSRAAFERAPVGMAEISPDGRLLRVNDALVDLLGYPRDELLRRTDMELTWPDDAASAGETFAKAASAGEATTIQLDKRYLHAGGRPIWVAFSAVAITDATGHVQHLLAHYLDITDRKLSDARLEHLADHDPLTGLFNRRGFDAALARQLAAVHRYGPAGALMILDLDNFKEVNDTYGHAAGDELIAWMAELLRRTLRESDTVARLGGDEFAVILPRGGRVEVQAAADRLIRATHVDTPVLADAHRRIQTVSIGIVLLEDLTASAGSLLKDADRAMYVAKQAGRDGYSFHGDATT